MRKYWPLALALACLVAGWLAHRPGPAPVRYRTVTVTKAAIEADRPEAKPLGIIARATERDVKPEQVAVAPGAALPDVREYCADFARRMARTDTVRLVDTVPLPPPILPSAAVKGDPGRVSIWLPLSDGSEWRSDVRVGRHYTLATDGDSIVVHTRRGDWLVTWGGRLLWLGVGAALGAVAH